MLYGVDVSHHNGTNWVQVASKGFPLDFCIMKATEGMSYHDNMILENISICEKNNISLRGFYHYARPELSGHTPEKEAAFFVSSVKHYLDGSTILALDYEGKALNISIDDGDKWALGFCREVEKLCGVKPFLYTSKAYFYRFKRIASDNIGLWAARYNGNPCANVNGGQFKSSKLGDVSPWKFFALWQWTSSPIDRDIFNGNEEAWKRYARVK